MKRLYLHIGTHKTGSTAIQHALRANRKKIESHGCALIPYPPASRQLMIDSAENMHTIDLARNQLQLTLRHPLRRRKAQYVMSWEGFSGDPWHGYYNTGVVAKSLRAITLGLDVTIIVYLRRQDDFVESLYTQSIQKGHSSSFADFVAQFGKDCFNWRELVKHYEDCFGEGNVIPRRYHEMFLPDRQSLLRDFSETINLPFILALPGSDLRNPSMSRQALEIARVTNPYLSSEQQKCLRTILQKSNAKELFEAFGFFDISSRDEFLSRHAASNASINLKYFGDSSGPLFPAPSALPGEEGSDVPVGTTVNAGEVVANIIRFLHAQGKISEIERKPDRLIKSAAEALTRHPRLHRLMRFLVRGLLSQLIQ